MKFKFVIILLFSFTIIYGQCNLSTLNYDFLGKEYFEVNNTLISSVQFSNLKENLSNGNKKNPDYKASFNYISGNHYQKFISFDEKFNKCFTNKTVNDNVAYSLKLIDNLVYKITITKKYELDDFENYKSDVLRLEELIKKTYKYHTGSYSISNKFNITRENPEGESLQTGSSQDYSKVLIPKNKLWKVNSSEISYKKEYSYGKIAGYSEPAVGYELSIEFTNLNNTILDNRGY